VPLLFTICKHNVLFGYSIWLSISNKKFGPKEVLLYQYFAYVNINDITDTEWSLWLPFVNTMFYLTDPP
jgi:hypothetical protein